MSEILKNLPVGSYAVIFPSIISGEDEDGYMTLKAHLFERAQEIEGYLGLESATIGDFKLSIAYYENKEAIERWRQDGDHLVAKAKARTTWLKDWQIRICKIEDIYGK